MTTRNAVTKKLKTGQRVTLSGVQKWAVVFDDGATVLRHSRAEARACVHVFSARATARIVRLNPITGVVSK